MLLLHQLVTCYEISQNTHNRSSLSLTDIFSNETFSLSFDQSLIVSLHHDFTECLQTFSAAASDCIFYSRYYRGIVCFHSTCYTRRGHAISHFVSVRSSSCTRNNTCFASVIFFFFLRNQHYAFLKLYPCLARSLLSTLTRTVVPFVKDMIDSIFKFFYEEVFFFKILPVSSIVKKVIRIPTLEKSICSFACVDFEFEHD
jgi:hypothetical protein